MALCKLISAKPEKGTAVAAAEYISKAYPNRKGFSPKNLRRMQEFCLVYKDDSAVLGEVMAIDRTRNTTILESCESLEERTWYIRAARQFGWTKMQLLENIRAGAHQESSLLPALANDHSS